MHLINQEIFGVIILLLLGALVIIKKIATGSILDKPKGNFLIQIVNIFNLFFLLIVNPLTAILLIARPDMIDATRIAVTEPLLLKCWEIAGLVFYVTGFFLMTWALICMGNNYQLGGSMPRKKDKLVTAGPFRLLRHPMYAAALSISAGIFCLTQSWPLFVVFVLYFILILPLIGAEEEGLQKAYGKQYISYRQKTKKLIPYIY